MRLYHHPISSNARRVVMAAKLLGTPLELVEVDLMDEGDRRRLAEINPNGKVPVLQDGAMLLWESCAILQYLADCAPDQTLYPQDVAARADVNRWMFWACQHFAPAISVLTWERVWKGMVGAGPTDPLEVARGERELAECAAVLERHLAGREWLAGKSLSLADIAVAPPLMYTAMAQLALAGYPNLQAWFGRMQALDAWQQTEASL
jgi:glutathione S-transferase